jgi:hypothetical protein
VGFGASLLHKHFIHFIRTLQALYPLFPTPKHLCSRISCATPLVKILCQRSIKNLFERYNPSTHQTVKTHVGRLCPSVQDGTGGMHMGDSRAFSATPAGSVASKFNIDATCFLGSDPTALTMLQLDALEDFYYQQLERISRTKLWKHRELRQWEVQELRRSVEGLGVLPATGTGNVSHSGSCLKNAV